MILQEFSSKHFNFLKLKILIQIRRLVIFKLSLLIDFQVMILQIENPTIEVPDCKPGTAGLGCYLEIKKFDRLTSRITNPVIHIKDCKP